MRLLKRKQDDLFDRSDEPLIKKRNGGWDDGSECLWRPCKVTLDINTNSQVANREGEKVMDVDGVIPPSQHPQCARCAAGQGGHLSHIS